MSLLNQTRTCHVIGVGKTSNKIWGDTDILKSFVPAAAALVPTPPTSSTQSIKARRHRRYPGDPGYAVRAGERKRLNRIPPKGAGALPGRKFALALVLATGQVDEKSKSVFTYQGTFTNLVANIDGMASEKLIIYSPTGHPYPVNPAP
jgi:hypothetical protein